MKNILVVFLLLVSCFTVNGQSNNVTYSGKINGFNTSWNFNSGTLIVKNMVTQLTESYIIPIDQQGNFSTEFFLDHNQECWVGFPFFNSTVYFGQDKHIIQDFDVTEPTAVTHVFKGDFAQINNDVNKVRSFLAPDWDQIYKEVYSLSAQEFKTYFLKIKEQKINQLDSIRNSVGLHDKAYDLTYRTISYSIAGSLIKINSIRESAFRRQQNLSFENRDPMSEPLKLQPAYYGFLRDLTYNDRAAMEVFEYGIFINNLKMLELITDQAEKVDYTEVINQFKQGDTTDQQLQTIIVSLQKSMDNKDLVFGAIEKVRPSILRDLLQTDISQELQLIELQNIATSLDYKKIPLTDDSLARIAATYQDHYMYGQIQLLNDQIKGMVDSSKLQQGSTTSRESTLKVGERTLEDLMAPYKGKILFIDFWATWCGPCLAAIKEMAEIKPEFNNDIIFLYITNNTSPESAFQVVSPTISGEHYRLTANEYAELVNRFNINGIPRYMIADRTGQILQDDFHWLHAQDLRRKLIQFAK